MCIRDSIYSRKPFDAYELIGGFHLREAESNHLQVIYYQEERAKGKDMPIVGVSDAHGCDTGEPVSYTHLDVYKRQPLR